MITKSDGKSFLKIFNNFQIDNNLPKHVDRTKSTITGVTISGSNFINNEWNSAISLPSPSILINEAIENDPDSLSLNEMLMYENNSFTRFKLHIKIWFFKQLKKFKKKKTPIISYTALQEFFQRIPFQNVTQSIELVKYYENALLHVEKTGQVALKEKLTKILNTVRYEISLIDNKLTKFVSEEQLVTLYEKVNAEQKLKLTWIKNFVKIIPTDVLTLKEKADALKIFDNYVILHFDPNNDATNLTAEEIKIAKDPIMFGVFENSRKLYYIADWVDDYCNLTLESMFETLGDKVLEINNESVKSFIDNQR